MADLQDIIAIKQQAESELLSRPGVRGVDVGFKIAGGRLYRDWIVIRVFVEQKGYFAPGEEIPSKIGEYDTDVIEVGTIGATVDIARYRPLLGSVSACANQAGTAGTLSAVVRDRVTRDIMVLSASHVFAPNDSSSFAVLQPSPADGGIDPADRVAAVTTRRSRIAGVTGTGGTIGRDCAVAAITVDMDVSNFIAGIGPVNGNAPAVLGEACKKRGRTSGLTFGTVTGIDATVTVTYSGTIPQTTYFHQISVQAAAPSTIFQDVGDSGALLLNAQNEATGLMYASSTDHITGFASPMQTVLDALGVDFLLDGLYENRSIISWNNHLERPGASLAASSEAGTLGVKNLILPHLGVKWRTVDASPAWFSCDIGSSREIAVIGLFGTNFSPSAIWQIRLSTAGAGLADVWDTGTITAGIVEGYQQAVYVLPSPVQARFVRVDFQDPGAAGEYGYYEVGIAWAAPAWQPSLNFALGYLDGFQDPSLTTRSRGGQVFIDKRQKYRVRQVLYDMLDEDEVVEQAHELERIVGVGDNLLFVPEPFSADTINRQALLGRLTQLNPTQLVNIRSWQKGYSLEERL